MNSKIRDGKTYDRLYYQQNKERILKRSAEYYRKNKETIRKYRREHYYSNNKERFYEAYKRYYRKHAERINARKRHNKEQKRLANGIITSKCLTRFF